MSLNCRCNIIISFLLYLSFFFMLFCTIALALGTSFIVFNNWSFLLSTSGHDTHVSGVHRSGSEELQGHGRRSAEERLHACVRWVFIFWYLKCFTFRCSETRMFFISETENLAQGFQKPSLYWLLDKVSALYVRSLNSVLTTVVSQYLQL